MSSESTKTLRQVTADSYATVHKLIKTSRAVIPDEKYRALKAKAKNAAKEGLDVISKCDDLEEWRDLKDVLTHIVDDEPTLEELPKTATGG